MTNSTYRYAKSSARNERHQSQGMIVFWGDPLSFSDLVLRLAESEAGTMSVRRVGGLDEIDGSAGFRRFIFFDENVVDDVLVDPHARMVERPATRWILAYRDDRAARRLLALRRGDPTLASFGLLPMNLPIDQWTPMFRLVLSGDCFLPVQLLDHEVDGDASQLPRHDPIDALLTPREGQVLRLVAEGKRNKTIAYELGLSEHTVKLHLHHVIAKLNVRNRTQAAQRFLTQKFGVHQ